MYNYVKEIDLHGETTTSAFLPLNGFIYESYCEGLKVIAVVHGKSGNNLKRTVHKLLKENKYIEKYVLDENNIGRTIIFLRSKR